MEEQDGGRAGESPDLRFLYPGFEVLPHLRPHFLLANCIYLAYIQAGGITVPAPKTLAGSSRRRLEEPCCPGDLRLNGENGTCLGGLFSAASAKADPEQNLQ
jgi:hypothetical protein